MCMRILLQILENMIGMLLNWKVKLTKDEMPQVANLLCNNI